MYICTCNFCGNIYDDTNPTDVAKSYDITLLKLKSIEDTEDFSIDKSFMEACPVCETDGNLTDGINWPALNKTARATLLENNILPYYRINDLKVDQYVQHGYISQTDEELRAALIAIASDSRPDQDVMESLDTADYIKNSPIKEVLETLMLEIEISDEMFSPIK